MARVKWGLEPLAVTLESRATRAGAADRARYEEARRRVVDLFARHGVPEYADLIDEIAADYVLGL